jgi:hypothetical protein
MTDAADRTSGPTLVRLKPRLWLFRVLLGVYALWLACLWAMWSSL